MLLISKTILIQGFKSKLFRNTIQFAKYGLENKDKTVMAVSHDDRYFDQCDRLVKLDYGRIVGQESSN